LISPITPEHLELLLPLACDWAAEREQHILGEGEALSAAQLNDARRVGIAHSERVRLLYVPEILPPTHPMLRKAAESTNLISPFTGGLTLRYGIFIRSDCRGNRPLVVHELCHTLQYERMGGFEPFLRQYLSECLTIGYPEAPMEQEVIDRAARICG
jgi:hypothetical protein